LDGDVDRGALEERVKGILASYGIDAKNLFVDWELKTIVVICGHITSRMKLFMSKGTVSLGAVIRDSLVSAHRIKVSNDTFGLIVIYCKQCFDKGLRMMLEGGDV